jgi:hypothetical protein
LARIDTLKPHDRVVGFCEGADVPL